jgi:hypothetical protein
VTGFIGVFLAVVAGWYVRDRRHVMATLGLPFLVLTVIQTVGIGIGDGVSPPSTVTAFPGAISYYVVQVIIFAVALGIALQLSSLRFRRSASAAGRPRVAYLVNAVLSVAIVAAVQLDRPFFDPGSVSQHRSSGSPPVIGIAGFGLSLATCAILGAITLRSRWSRRTTSEATAV